MKLIKPNQNGVTHDKGTCPHDEPKLFILFSMKIGGRGEVEKDMCQIPKQARSNQHDWHIPSALTFVGKIALKQPIYFLFSVSAFHTLFGL